MEIPIRRGAVRYRVEIDPTLDKRGRCIRPVAGVPAAIKLRAWDEEVFLHECIHALFTDADITLTEDQEEQVVQQVSHGLFEIGWRYTGERPPSGEPT